MKTLKRKLTLNERLYRINESISPPNAIQVIIQGKGLFEAELLSKKIKELTDYIPALKLKQEGHYWTFNGTNPELTIHNHELPAINHPFFSSPLNTVDGHCCEFHLFQTTQSNLVFRVLHSAMDGIGALIVLERLFSLLRNETIAKITNHLHDIDFRKSLNKTPAENRGSYKFKWRSIRNDIASTAVLTSATELIKLDNKVSNVIGKIAKWYMTKINEPAQFLIPVNMRRHNLNVETVSNLSLPIFLQTNLNQSDEEIQGELLKQLFLNKELAKDKLEFFAVNSPDWLLKIVIRYGIRKAHRSQKYPMSGFISDLGSINLLKFSTSQFEASDIYALPVFVGLAPFCVTICHHDGGTRITFSVPDNLDSNDLRNELFESLTISNHLSEKNNLTEEFFISNYSDRLTTMWSQILELPKDQIGPNDFWSDLGGDSVSLLFLISEVSENFVSKKHSQFMNDSLKNGGKLTLNSILKNLENYQ